MPSTLSPFISSSRGLTRNSPLIADESLVEPVFQYPCGLELLHTLSCKMGCQLRFNALAGLSCYRMEDLPKLIQCSFNALAGLSYYMLRPKLTRLLISFNALAGLSCYCKTIQHFLIFKVPFNAYFPFGFIHFFLWTYINTLSNIFQPIFRCEFPGIFLGTCLSHLISG